MLNKKVLLGVMLSIGMLLGIGVYAQAPPVTVGHRHPNLQAAQRLCDQAYQKITAAQQANEFDMGGHAAKAKELLDQASREIKEAAESANEHR
jgi:hypothetical protein